MLGLKMSNGLACGFRLATFIKSRLVYDNQNSAPRRWIHVDRVARGHRYHCGSGGAVVACVGGCEIARAANRMHQQSEANGGCPPDDIRRYWRPFYRIARLY